MVTNRLFALKIKRDTLISCYVRQPHVQSSKFLFDYVLKNREYARFKGGHWRKMIRFCSRQQWAQLSCCIMWGSLLSCQRYRCFSQLLLSSNRLSSNTCKYRKYFMRDCGILSVLVILVLWGIPHYISFTNTAILKTSGHFHKTATYSDEKLVKCKWESET